MVIQQGRRERKLSTLGTLKGGTRPRTKLGIIFSIRGEFDAT